MIKEQHKQKITISYSDNMTYNYKKVKIPFLKIMDLVKSDFNYSAGTFENGHRKADNYLNYSDLIILDIDEGLTIKEAKKIFEPFDYILATTKSHQKQKDKKAPCDRFRIILPTDTPITLNKEEYTQMMTEVHNEYNFVDKSCKDASRFYYPTKDAEVFIHGGFCNFYWEDYWEKAKPSEEIEKRLKDFKSNYIGYTKVDSSKNHEYTMEHIDVVRNMCGTEKILEKLKVNEKMVSGQRNTTLYSYVRYFEDLGMSADEIKNNILWINANSNGISEDEIEKTIFKRLK